MEFTTMVILENVQIPEQIKVKAMSLDETALNRIAQIENSQTLFAGFYTRPDQLDEGSYRLVADNDEDCFWYCVVFNEDGEVVTQDQIEMEKAEFNMREHIQITAVFNYECPARLDAKAQIEAVSEDLNRLLDADSNTNVECHRAKIIAHKSEAEIYSDVAPTDAQNTPVIPKVVVETARSINSETFVEVEPLHSQNGYIARYLTEQNLKCYGQSLINCGIDGRMLKGIVIKADGSVPREAEARQILLDKRHVDELDHQRSCSEKLLTGLRSIYEDEPDNPAVLVKDALCDLRHVCDVYGLSFGNIDTSAQALYSQEIAENQNTKDDV
jgi:hypothetical protein